MISIVIAEDQYMLRQAMVQLIELNEDMKVVDDFDNGEETLNFIKQHPPDVAILDIELPRMTGLEVLAKLRENFN